MGHCGVLPFREHSGVFGETQESICKPDQTGRKYRLQYQDVIIHYIDGARIRLNLKIYLKHINYTRRKETII